MVHTVFLRLMEGYGKWIIERFLSFHSRLVFSPLQPIFIIPGFSVVIYWSHRFISIHSR